MKKVLFLFALLALLFEASAQQIVKSGGTSNSTFLFGNTGYARKTQLLYPASVLSNVRSGKIVRLYFKYGSTGTTNNQTLSHFRIKLGQTLDEDFPSGTAPFYTDLISVKHDTSFVIPSGTSGNWFPIDLDSSFAYDSTQTLIVQVSFSASQVANWGTNGTNNTGPKKIISPDTAATVGDGTSSTWQDMGFDLLVTSTKETIRVATAAPFPNPATDFLHLPDWKPGQVCILSDVQGRTQTLIPDPDGRLDIRHLQSGVYDVRIKGRAPGIRFSKQ